MSQTTFDGRGKWRSLDQLTDKQLRIVRLLREGLTQATISRRLRVSRASVNQTCKFLEQNNLIKKEVNERYNILYSVAPQLQKRIGGIQEQVTACRVHSIALKFHVISQDHPVSIDKRSGYSKSWKMRGGERFAYWFPGKAGEIACTATVHPRTIVIRMDAGQKILARDVQDAEQRGFQHLIHVRQQFIEKQRLFGVNLEIEPTGQRMGKVHGGFAGSRENPVMQEGVTTPGWWIDKSGKGELGEDKLELEAHTERGGPTRLDNLIKASEQFEHLPDMVRSCIDPLSQNIQRVEALIQGGTTSEMKMNQLMGVIGSLLERLLVLEKKLESKGLY